MISEQNAVIHAGILIAIALLIYHFFIREDVAEGFGSDVVDNGLAGYPGNDSAF